MQRIGITLLLVVCFLGLLTGIATADQVTLGQSINSTAWFAGQLADAISFSATCSGHADCLSGYAYDGYLTGNYDFWIVNGNANQNNNNGVPELGAPNQHIYPVLANGATFHLSININGDLLGGVVTLDTVTGGGNAPLAQGSLAIMTATGSTFAGWQVGSVAPMDFVINLYGRPTIEQVWTGNAASTNGPVSSGEVVNQPTPEPASLALLGSGFLTVGAFLRRRRA